MLVFIPSGMPMPWQEQKHIKSPSAGLDTKLDEIALIASVSFRRKHFRNILFKHGKRDLELILPFNVLLQVLEPGLNLFAKQSLRLGL
jgi:hypothetical protein